MADLRCGQPSGRCSRQHPALRPGSGGCRRAENQPLSAGVCGYHCANKTSGKAPEATLSRSVWLFLTNASLARSPVSSLYCTPSRYVSQMMWRAPLARAAATTLVEALRERRPPFVVAGHDHDVVELPSALPMASTAFGGSGRLPHDGMPSVRHDFGVEHVVESEQRPVCVVAIDGQQRRVSDQQHPWHVAVSARS